jgi:hypothetical protein
MGMKKSRVADDKVGQVPAAIAWPGDPALEPIQDATKRFEVPFELLKLTVDVAVPSQPHVVDFDIDVQATPPPVLDDFVPPATAVTGETTGNFRLDEFLSSVGDTLMLGNPLHIVETSVLRNAVAGANRTESRICIGADIEAMLGPQTVLSKRAGRPAVEMSGFEAFVFAQIDGVSTVSTLSTSTGLAAGDLRIALALLADKGQLVVTFPLAPAVVAMEAQAVGLSLVHDEPAKGSPSSGAVSAISRSFGPVTILRPVGGADTRGLSAFERHVLSLVDGKRSITSVAADSGLTESDLKMALDLLSRRGVVEVVPMAPRAAAAAAKPSPVPPLVEASRVDVVPVLMSLPGQALLVGPGSPAPGVTLEALLGAAERAESLGDMRTCIASLQRATAAFPTSPLVFNRLGVAMARSGDLRGALAALGQALELSPTDPTITSNFARIAALAG